MKNLLAGLTLILATLSSWGSTYETAGISLGENEVDVTKKVKLLGYDEIERTTYIVNGKDTRKTYTIRFVKGLKQGTPISFYVQFSPLSGKLVALDRQEKIDPPTGIEKFKSDVIAKYGKPDEDNNIYMQWNTFAVPGGPKAQSPNECSFSIPLPTALNRKSRCGTSLTIGSLWSGADTRIIGGFTVHMADFRGFVDELAEAFKQANAAKDTEAGQANRNPGPKL